MSNLERGPCNLRVKLPFQLQKHVIKIGGGFPWHILPDRPLQFTAILKVDPCTLRVKLSCGPAEQAVTLGVGLTEHILRSFVSDAGPSNVQ